MKKKSKLLIAALCVAVPLLLAAAVLLVLQLHEWMKKQAVRDIAAFESPDRRYSLLFQQVGDPVFPFGKTDVRLVLKDNGGRILKSVDAELLDDGANAVEGNIRSVTWGPDAVTVVLQASEMEDLAVEIPYSASISKIEHSLPCTRYVSGL